MEGKSDVADLALSLQLEGSFISIAAFEFLVILSVLSVHEIEIEVVHSAPLKLVLEEGPDVLLLFKIVFSELVCQQEALPGIAAGKT